MFLKIYKMVELNVIKSHVEFLYGGLLYVYIVTRPVGLLKLTSMSVYEIINWYSLKVFGFWNYYCCVDNIWELKQTLNWIFRYSLLGTLAAKHKCSLKQIISRYSLNPKFEYTFLNKKKKRGQNFSFFPF